VYEQIVGILAQETTEEVSEAKDLYPHANELIVGLVAFAILFAFMWKWILPRFRQVIEDRRNQIQGNLEKAEVTRNEADTLLEEYRRQLAGAREESNRIIEEARKTADQLRKDLQAKAEQEAAATVARAQEEIRAERDRVFQDLQIQVGEIAVDLAGRVVGESLDPKRHEKLIDDYISQVAASGNGKGVGQDGNRGEPGS
jgi:F-type H+-transporting ATPase subunit b